jgi:CubicO group peptidase (beta-lactamase class C family)
VIAPALELPLSFNPESSYEYSNTGFMMLALILEDVSGRSWEKFLRKEIFDRLGMDNSGVDFPERIIPGRATAYIKKEGVDLYENGRWGDRALYPVSRTTISTYQCTHSLSPSIEQWKHLFDRWRHAQMVKGPAVLEQNIE